METNIHSDRNTLRTNVNTLLGTMTVAVALQKKQVLAVDICYIYVESMEKTILLQFTKDGNYKRSH